MVCGSCGAIAVASKKHAEIDSGDSCSAAVRAQAQAACAVSVETSVLKVICPMAISLLDKEGSIMRHLVRTFVPVMLLAALFMLSACGPSGTVRLLHRPADAPQIPGTTAPSISVVQLKDARPNSYIGVRRDDTPFIPNGTIPDWVTQSLADALTRQGLRVTYAQGLETARASQPQYILTGELQELWIRDSSRTDISASVKVFISVAGHKGKLVNEGMTSSLSKQGLPGSAAAEELLYNTVQELVQSVANKTQQAIAAQR
jgi:uncharacterized lipoprotein YajG